MRLQPAKSCGLAVLQALRHSRDGGGPRWELITDTGVLASLLDLLLLRGKGAQGTCGPTGSAGSG